VGQDAPATLRPAPGGEQAPEVDEKVEAVRDARDRLGHDVDLMAGELRAAVGVTIEKLLRRAALAVAAAVAGALLRRLLAWAWRTLREARGGGATRTARRRRAGGRAPTLPRGARAGRTARRR